MVRIVRHAPGRTAIPYMQTQLSYGHTLSQALSAAVPFGSGRIWTHIRDDTPLAQADDVDYGCILPHEHPGEGNAVSAASVAFLAQLMQAQASSYCIVEDFNSRAAEVAAETGGYATWNGHICPYVTHRDHVLVYVARGDATAERVEEVIGCASSAFITNGCLSASRRLDAIMQPGRQLTDGDMRIIVDHVFAVFVDAYDHEGRAVWVREGAV